jgi:glutathionylspermidine synthase
MYEFNADTPTSISEASLAKWCWKKDVRPEADQFNSLHGALIARWSFIRKHYADIRLLHFVSMFDSQEDVCNPEYPIDTALQAGWAVEPINRADIGIDALGTIQARRKAADTARAMLDPRGGDVALS